MTTTQTLPLPRHARSCTCEGSLDPRTMCADCVILRPMERALAGRPAGHRRLQPTSRRARRDERGSARVPGLARLVAQRTGVTPDLHR